MQTNIIHNLIQIISNELNLKSTHDLNRIQNALKTLPDITFGNDYYYWINPDDLTIEQIDPSVDDFDPKYFHDIEYLIEDHSNPKTDSMLRFSIY